MLSWILIISTVVSTLLDEQRITTNCLFLDSPFWKKCYLNWRLALRKPVDPSCLSLFRLFLRLSCIFMCCVHDCLLLPLFDVLLLTDPNGSPLQVSNPDRGDYYGPWSGHPVAVRYHCRHLLGLLRLGSLPAYLLKYPVGSPQTTLSSGRGARLLKGPDRNEPLGLNLTEYKEAMHVDLILEAIQERTGDLDRYVLLRVKLSYTYIWSIEYCLLKYILRRTILFCCFAFPTV